MEFCPKCGMRLVLAQKPSGEMAQTLLVCPKCGYERPVTGESPRLAKVIERKVQEHVAVIGEEEAKIRTMPVARTECPKCANREAYWWMVQTRGADESPTQFFRCTRCSYTWREIA